LIITGNIGTNGGAISGYDLPTIFNGLFYTRRYNKHFISQLYKCISKFWYLSKWSFNSSSYKTLTTNANYANVSLQAIATILPNQTIDIRWNTDSEEIVMGNRTLTLIKVQ
jgi:hypothetical protein